VRSLGKQFTIFDTNGDRLLDQQEFYWGLKNLNCSISKREANVLLVYLDTSKDGLVDFNEFLTGIRGQPAAERAEVIQRAFNKFDVYGQGCIQISDLESAFQCPRHPKILSGEMTNNDVFVDFLATFGVLRQLSYQQWADHYAAVSAQIMSTDQFIELMCTTWQL
jgi:Ca2+-binding EF-hand superfamily protein